MINSTKARHKLDKRLSIVIAAIVTVASSSFAQDSTKPDSVAAVDTARIPVSIDAIASTPETRCDRNQSDVTAMRVGAATMFVGTNALLYRYFKRAWWSGERAPHFFFHADWDEDFRDQDKFGHMFGGFQLARLGYALLRDACASPSHALLWSATYATLFQLQIEIWDGLYKKYGFSYADLLANTSGMLLAVEQRKHPALRAIKPTMSYSRSAAMRNRRNLPGEIRPTLDYSGQTYWFSTNVNALLPENAKRYWPPFIRVSAGHSITDWIDPQTGASIRAQRRILLTLDLDLEQLPGENHVWKTIKRNLSYLHLPSPALQLTPKFEGISWYR
jgi:hypothetical protein